MAYADFTALKVRIDQHIAWVTLNHPPINLLDLELIVELDQLGRSLTDDSSLKNRTPPWRVRRRRPLRDAREGVRRRVTREARPPRTEPRA